MHILVLNTTDLNIYPHLVIHKVWLTSLGHHLVKGPLFYQYNLISLVTLANQASKVAQVATIAKLTKNTLVYQMLLFL